MRINHNRAESRIQCCKSGLKCDSELETRHVCHDGNQTYYEGQTFTPAGDRGDAVQCCWEILLIANLRLRK